MVKVFVIVKYAKNEKNKNSKKLKIGKIFLKEHYHPHQKTKKISVTKLNYVDRFSRNLCGHEILQNQEKLKNAISYSYT